MAIHLGNEPLLCPSPKGLYSVPGFLEQKQRAKGQRTLARDNGKHVVDHSNKSFRFRVAPQGIHQEGDDQTAPWDLSF